MTPKPDDKFIPYHPIDCDLYDELVLLSMGRKQCHICYRDEQGLEVQCSGQIIDIASQDGQEFLILQQGSKIRLDALLSINDQTF
jgi:Rho-binding antiterminator